MNFIKKFVKTVLASLIEHAEMAKLYENIFRSKYWTSK